MALCCVSVFATARLVVSNGGDDFVPAPVSAAKSTPGKLDLNPRQMLGSNAIYISSMCALTSPNLAQSRIYVMGGLAGANVPTDRTLNPAAWYRVPTSSGTNYGLQWFDWCVTTSKSWLGGLVDTNSASKDEHGGRVVISPQGVGSPNGYWVRITTSLTNIAPAYFPISTNSDGVTPLPFSYTFVGLNYGPNGVLDSAWSSQSAKWVAAGDDTVYDGSQGTVYPHQVAVDFFQRFGSSVFITANSIGDFVDVMRQFALKPHITLTAELVTNGVTVASETVVAAVPSLVIWRLPNGMIRIEMIGGQYNYPYDIETAADVQGAPWLKIDGQTLFLGSQGYFDVPSTDPMRFYRLKARSNAVWVPPAD